MAKRWEKEPTEGPNLPTGVTFLRRYRSTGLTLVECSHPEEMLEPLAARPGVFCRFCKGDAQTTVRWALPVKKLIVQWGRFPEYASVETPKIRAWLRHWRRQVELGQSDLVYDPAAEVAKLTEELLARGAKA